MSALAVFAFGEQMVRIDDRGGLLWFVANDVCAALEIANPRHALTRLPEREKGVVTNDTLGGRQEVSVISEPGMYRLVMTSRKESALRFQDWVVGEVLPSIRRTGRFAIAAAEVAEPANDEPDFDTAEGRDTIFAKLAVVRMASRTFGRAAAQEAWRQCGLPDVALRAAAGFIAETDETIQRWLAERTDRDRGARLGAADAYRDYVAWTESGGQVARSQRWFSQHVAAAGVAKLKSDRVQFLGIRLRSHLTLAA